MQFVRAVWVDQILPVVVLVQVVYVGGILDHLLVISEEIIIYIVLL